MRTGDEALGFQPQPQVRRQEDHLAGDRADRWLGGRLERLQQPGEPVRLGSGVVVQQDRVRGRDLVEREVVATREPEVAGGFQDAHVGVVAAHQLDRAVGAGVVDDPGVKTPVALAGQPVEAGREQVGAVPVDDDDGGDFSGELESRTVRHPRRRTS